MQFLKVSCAQCPHYQQCPQKTKFFVNYCGSDLKKVKDNIRSAVLECRARRGGLFSTGLNIQLQQFPLIEPAHSQ